MNTFRSTTYFYLFYLLLAILKVKNETYNSAPSVVIVSPDDGQVFEIGETVKFSCTSI